MQQRSVPREERGILPWGSSYLELFVTGTLLVSLLVGCLKPTCEAQTSEGGQRVIRYCLPPSDRHLAVLFLEICRVDLQPMDFGVQIDSDAPEKMG